MSNQRGKSTELDIPDHPQQPFSDMTLYFCSFPQNEQL